MNRAWLGLALLILGLGFGPQARAYMILHQDLDLAQPELYRPDRGGRMPTPGNPAQPIRFVLSGNLPFPEAARQAFSHWAEVPGAAVVFIDGGVVELTGDWTTRVAAPDGRNTVEWVDQDWILGSTVIAWTNLFTDPLTGKILEADIYLNGQNFAWSELDGSQDHPESDPMDMENVVTHEIGHLFGLAHSQVQTSTMWAITLPGETHKRTLHPDDRDGLRYRYPETAADYPAPSLWGIRAGACQFSENSYTGYQVLAPGAGTLEFCLFGAGILAGVSPGLDRDGVPWLPNPVSGSTLVSENLVQATLDYTGLATGAYDPALVNPGSQTGELFQGIFINTAGNQLPVAVAAADQEQVTRGETVILNGTGSSDPEGARLTYQWLGTEAPENAALSLQNSLAGATQVVLPEPGVYIFNLVVNDGIVDSLADSVVVTAVPPVHHQDDGGCGCALQPGASPAGAIWLLAPLLFFLVRRKIRGGQGSRLG